MNNRNQARFDRHGLPIPRQTLPMPKVVAPKPNEIDFDPVLDEFKRQDRMWSGIAILEANLAGQRLYRWMPDGKLGISGAGGVTLRAASDLEYTDLEQGISKGRVTITRFSRVSRQTDIIFDKEGLRTGLILLQSPGLPG